MQNRISRLELDGTVYSSIRHNEGKKCSRYQSSAVFIKCNISCIVQFHAYNSRRHVALRGRETGILLISPQEPYSILFLVCSALCVTFLFLLMLKSLMVFSFTQLANSDMEKIEKKFRLSFISTCISKFNPRLTFALEHSQQIIKRKCAFLIQF